MPNTKTMTPDLLVTYVSAAADDLLNEGATSYSWALEEAAQLLQAEQARMTDPLCRKPAPEIAALSRSLGPVDELSDLVLRAISDGPSGLPPASKREQRLGALQQIIELLDECAAGSVDAQRRVLEVFSAATEIVLGRSEQPELV